MILVFWNDRWFLATKARPDKQACSLTAGNWQELKPLGFIERQGSTGKPTDSNYQERIYWTKFVPDMATLIFYPSLFFRDYQVIPWNGWHPTSEEPLLQCFIDLGEIHRGEPGEGEHRIQELIDDGWQYNAREGALKYVHVDELEKAEGPPPEGAF